MYWVSPQNWGKFIVSFWADNSDSEFKNLCGSTRCQVSKPASNLGDLKRKESIWRNIAAAWPLKGPKEYIASLKLTASLLPQKLRLGSSEFPGIGWPIFRGAEVLVSGRVKLLANININTAQTFQVTNLTLVWELMASLINLTRPLSHGKNRLGFFGKF